MNQLEEAITEFLEELSARGFEPLFARCSGTIRFEMTEGRSGERLAVNIDHGRIEVSREELAADSVVRGDRAVLNDLISGRRRVAAILRGELEIEGDLGLPMALQRLFPGPQGVESRGRRER